VGGGVVLAGEALLEDGHGPLGVGAGNGEVVVGVVLAALADAHHGHEGHEPQGQHPPSVVGDETPHRPSPPTPTFVVTTADRTPPNTLRARRGGARANSCAGCVAYRLP